MIGTLAKIIKTSNLFQNVKRYSDKVLHKSIFCIFWFEWLIALYLFTPLPCNAIFLILKHRCVREELSDVVFFLQTQLQQITVQEHLFGEFALAPLTFGPCTSPTDTFSFPYHFPSVSIPISNPLNCRPICLVDNFQRFHRHTNILDNPCWIRCSHFWFPYTFDSSGENHICFIVIIHFGDLQLSPKTYLICCYLSYVTGLSYFSAVVWRFFV